MAFGAGVVAFRRASRIFSGLFASAVVPASDAAISYAVDDGPVEIVRGRLADVVPFGDGPIVEGGLIRRGVDGPALKQALLASLGLTEAAPAAAMAPAAAERESRP